MTRRPTPTPAARLLKAAARLNWCIVTVGQRDHATAAKLKAAIDANQPAAMAALSVDVTHLAHESRLDDRHARDLLDAYRTACRDYGNDELDKVADRMGIDRWRARATRTALASFGAADNDEREGA